MLNIESKVDQYFLAWGLHDKERLRDIFSRTISYRRAGKAAIDGLKEVEEYWLRNSNRQKQLRIDYKIIESKEKIICVIFVAKFRNVEQGNAQTVHGLIKFFFDSDQKICVVDETYQRLIDSSDTGVFARLKEWSSEVARHLNARLGRILNRIEFVPHIVGVTFFLLGLTIWVLGPKAPVLFLFSSNFWTGAFNDLTQQDMTDLAEWAKILCAYVVGGYGVLTVLGNKVAEKLAYGRAHQIFDLDDENAAARIMAEYIKDSTRVAIFSGDFDFIALNSNLLETLSDASEKKILTLFAEDNRASVMDKSRRFPELQAVFANLEHCNEIFYETGFSLRATYVRKKGVDIVLSKQTSFGNAGLSINRVSVMKGIGIYERPTQVIRQLFEATRENYRRNFLRKRRKLSFGRSSVAVIVTGKCCSGKSTIARALEAQGYYYVSAGDVLGEMAKETEDAEFVTRRQKIDLGVEILTTQGAERFGEILIENAAEHSLVVFDGIRVFGAVTPIRASFDDVLVVYVETATATRVNRFLKDDDGSIGFDEVEKLQMEQDVEQFRDHVSMEILDGAQPVEENLQRLSRLRPNFIEFPDLE